MTFDQIVSAVLRSQDMDQCPEMIFSIVSISRDCYVSQQYSAEVFISLCKTVIFIIVTFS